MPSLQCGHPEPEGRCVWRPHRATWPLTAPQVGGPWGRIVSRLSSLGLVGSHLVFPHPKRDSRVCSQGRNTGDAVVMEACSSGWVRRKRARGSRSPGLARRIQRPGGRWQVGSKASEGPGVLTLALALVPYLGAAVEEEDPLGQGGVSPREGVGPGPGRHLPTGQEDGAASPFPLQSLWILAVGGGQTRTIRGPLWGRGDRTCKRVLRGQGRPQLTSEGKRE